MGLYDDDNSSITGGDIFDVIYWQTKFAAQKLDAALKSRQPESAIKGIIPAVIHGCDDLLATYPNHSEIQKWKQTAEVIQGKINPDAPPADFKSDFAHWKDYSYESGWRFYHLAKMAVEVNDWSAAHEYAGDTETHFGRILERMHAWPSEVHEWISSTYVEMAGLRETAASKK
ncbi:MAG TPA: hypothetical protein VGE50_01390 [Gammaproteobacteria bacterium]